MKGFKMQTFEVTYFLSRQVTITVTVPNGEDPRDYSDDQLTLNAGEDIIDIDYKEVGSEDEYERDVDFDD
jgi:hypothetical protein